MVALNSSLLTTLEQVPDGLLDARPEALYQILSGPTLIHLRGRRQPAVFVSTMLHGNEHTGLSCIQGILTKYLEQELPRDLSILIGNIDGARYGLRRLSHQPDYNRVWTGTGTPEHATMQEILRQMEQRGVFASIDIHNNTGLNPCYACINRLDDPFLYLASLFSRTVVYFIRPEGVQSAAFAQLCPALTLECGQPGGVVGLQMAQQLVNDCLHLQSMESHVSALREIDLFHNVATTRIPEDISFGFGMTATDIQFDRDLDRLNFSELPSNTTLARINTRNKRVTLNTIDEHGEDVDERYFCYEDGEIRTRRPIMLSMLTHDAQIIRQDCLCYLMERMTLPQKTNGH